MGCRDVEKIAFNEVVEGKGHGIPSMCCSMGESNVFVRRGRDASVRDGTASDVPGEIDKDALAVVIAFSDMDVPFGTAQFVTQVLPLLHGHCCRQA